MDTFTPIDAFNGFLQSAGLATIGILLVIIPVVFLSLSETLKKKSRKDSADDEQ